MKYILNEGRYAQAFIIEKKNGELAREVKIELDRRRRYTDTGNIATTGITAIEDEDFELLKKNKAFAQMFKKEGSGLSLVDEAMVTGEADPQASKLAEENKKLKEDLRKAQEAVKVSKDAKAMKDLADENATLKAQLEALKKADASEPVKDTEVKDTEVKDAGAEKADSEAEGF